MAFTRDKSKKLSIPLVPFKNLKLSLADITHIENTLPITSINTIISV